MKIKFSWKLVNESAKEIPVKIKSRPTCNIEEKEFTWAGGTAWIPESIIIEISKADAEELINESPKTLILKLYDSCDEPLEEWELSGTLLSIVNEGTLPDMWRSIPVPGSIELRISYNNVIYRSFCTG